MHAVETETSDAAKAQVFLDESAGSQPAEGGVRVELQTGILRDFPRKFF
jgi:hypothetical protein